jgi:hypothetical protein
MGTVTRTFSFPSNMEGWSTGAGFGYVSGDGEPDPGCLRVNGTAPVVTPASTSRFSIYSSGQDWEDYGVPAGQVVTNVAVSVQVKPVSKVGTISSLTMQFRVDRTVIAPGDPPASTTILSQSVLGLTVGNWTEVTGNNALNPLLTPSTTPINLSLSFQSFGAGSHQYQFYIDTIEITITYSGETSTPLTITPAAVTLTVETEQTFETNLPADFAITEGAGGSQTPASSTETSYTAPATPGTYHLVATDQDDPGNTATAVITVVNTAQTISPASATIPVGATQEFTTNNPADWDIPENNEGSGGPDGPAGNTDPAENSETTTYTAPLTPGVYHVRATDSANGSNSATATVNVIPLEAEAPVVTLPVTSQEFQVFLFDAEGARKPLPRTHVMSADWNDLRYGGWEQFNLDLAATFVQVAELTHGDRVEFWYRGERRYRGYVYAIERHEDDPQTIKVSGYGIAHRASKFSSNHAWVYPAQVDISRPFSDLIAENVLPLLPGLKVRSEGIGANVQQVESAYRMIGEVISDLCQQQGENRGLWGGDVDDDGYDRLFLKPFSDALDWTIPVPGRHATGAGNQRDSGDIVNRLTILGGNPRFPNLVPNSSFEEFRFSAAGDGNLVGDPSFEELGVWTGSGTVLLPEGAVASAYEGLAVCETDVDGMYAEQTQNPPASPVVPGWDYLLAVRARAETTDTIAIGRVTLTWKTSGGATISTQTLALPVQGSDNPQSLTTYWQTFQTVCRAPLTAAGFTLKIEAYTGAEADKGIHWDVVELYPVSAVYQNRWELQLAGASAINALNWAQRDGMDGGYCVYADVTATDASDGEIRLQPVGKERFAVQAGASYTASVHLKSPAGVYASGKLILEVVEYDGNGAENVINQIEIPAAGGFVNWTKKYQTVTLASDTTQVMVRLLFRGNSKILIDGVCFRASAAGTDFLRDGRFIAQIPSNDSALTGITAAAQSSIADYGYRDAIEQVDSITTIEDAREYATVFFNARAALFPEPSVELIEPTPFYRPGQLVRLIGEDGAVLMGSETGLPIVRIGWKYGSDGTLSCSLELKKELPDLASLFAKARKASGSGGGVSSSGSSGSGSGSSLAGSTLIVQELDGTPLVVNVTRVKVSNGALTDNGDGSVTLEVPQQEVVEARSSTLLGEFSSLDARLEAIEAYLTMSDIELGPGLDFRFDTNSMYLPFL